MSDQVYHVADGGLLMGDIKTILEENGYEVFDGYEATKQAIRMASDNNVTAPLCSGWRVFPDGTKCLGCSDCSVR